MLGEANPDERLVLNPHFVGVTVFNKVSLEAD